MSLPVLAAHGGGRPIEFWLAVLTAFGIVVFGWLCVALRVVNAWCAPAADPEWRVAVRGASVGSRRDGIRLGLWRRFGAGEWPREWLSLGEWTALGSLVGATLGMVFSVVGGSTV